MAAPVGGRWFPSGGVVFALGLVEAPLDSVQIGRIVGEGEALGRRPAPRTRDPTFLEGNDVIDLHRLRVTGEVSGEQLPGVRVAP